MEIHESLIAEYAKKIYGFAYSKTGNYHDAQDLSQNILLALLSIDFSAKDIADMDGYIYRVCKYSWSNFVRENKPFWEGVGYTEELHAAPAEDSPEDMILKRELYQQLRREIAYLGENKRRAMILYYYDNKSGKEISEELGVPASTVRWYLGESKKRLKERMQMNNDTMFVPKKLGVGFNGTAHDPKMGGLREELLVQNICIVCAKRALTVEEMAEELCTAAAFIEDKLGALLDMNYLEKISANKYRTTFFVEDADFIVAKQRFMAEHLPQLSKAIFGAVIKHFDEICKIGFHGCDFDRNFLLWALVTVAAHDYETKHQLPISCPPPIRGDGSRHWILATWEPDEVFRAYPTLSPALADLIRYSGGAAGKHGGNGRLVCQQFDPLSVCSPRNLWSPQEVSELERVHEIAANGLTPSEHDKEMIARFAEKGLVAVTDGVPSLLIPYFTADEYKAFRRIMEESVLADVEKEAGTTLPREYAEYIREYIPNYLPAAEKERLEANFYRPNACTYLLLQEGLLKQPTQEEAKRLCTIVWEV